MRDRTQLKRLHDILNTSVDRVQQRCTPKAILQHGPVPQEQLLMMILDATAVQSKAIALIIEEIIDVLEPKIVPTSPGERPH